MMNVETRISDEAAPSAPCPNAHLLRTGLDALSGFLEEKAQVTAALATLNDIGDETTDRLAARLTSQLAELEPSITMIGQVKAGKTSLVNAMVGWPGLLPADVNPWTSVVTSLHLDPHMPPDAETRASFRFFEPSEWERLLDKGGRIGELAARAGHNDELEKVRKQIEYMREKSRSRLGKRFELLLGQQHDYGQFDEELIERYVCLGDDFDDEDNTVDTQGRFADITKSADLFLHRPEFPMKLCIRDTPGVNDTFMMREQITIRSIRDSRICVVVLSAQQALSSVDMALIRLISNIRSREVVIFVNRIDELPDPIGQVEEIRESIKGTLKAHDGPVDAEIIFGSAHVANLALTDRLSTLDDETRRSIDAWSEAQDEVPADDLAAAWEFSGLPGLYRALSARISEGAGKEALTRAAKSAMNLAKGVQAARALGDPDAKPPKLKVDRSQLAGELDRVASMATQTLAKAIDAQLETYFSRLDRSHRSFLERATASLIDHLDKQGEDKVWKYEPTGLRLLLRSAYQVFGARVQGATRKVFEATAEELEMVFRSAFEIDGDGFAIEAPPVAHLPPPVLIGQTIALDIQGNWWRNWWRRRRGYHAFATEFYSMIESETSPVVNDLKTTQIDIVREASLEILKSFLDEQRATLLGFADQSTASEASSDGVLVLTARDRQRSAVEDTLAALNAYAA